MTWHTPCGNRVLGGYEAEIVRDVLEVIADRLHEFISSGDMKLIDEDSNLQCGIEVFDSLQLTEQLALFTQIAQYLLTETPAVLDLNAINESAVYAVIIELTQEVEIEIDCNAEPPDEAFKTNIQTYWRSRLLGFYRECHPEEFVNESVAGDTQSASRWIPTDERSTNLEQWEILIEALQNRLLWDEDFLMAGTLMDLDPTRLHQIKGDMAIDDQYFTAIAPDISDDQIKNTLAELFGLTKTKF